MDDDLAADLAVLVGHLPNPLRLHSELGRFLGNPIVQKWIAGGDASARRILHFMKACDDSSLIRVASILLFQLDRNWFYEAFLQQIPAYRRRTIEALEPGLWLGQIDEKTMIEDLIGVAKRSGNADIVLLLQRPGAQYVRPYLRTFIAEGKMPLSLFSLYAYGYALKPEDRAFLAEITDRKDRPELAALAGLYLLKLGFAEGKRGIRLGLLADDEELRASTYSSLAGLVPAATIARANYQVSREPQIQAVEMILTAL